MTATNVLAIEPDLGLEHLSATICAELAAGLSSASDILEKYDLTRNQWDKLSKSPAFRNMLKEAIKDWSGDLNAGKRIAKKAEIMLEDSMKVLYDIAHDEDKPAQQRLGSIEQMAKLSGAGKGEGKSEGGANGAVINIHIDTGADQPQTVTIDGTALPVPEDV